MITGLPHFPIILFLVAAWGIFCGGWTIAGDTPSRSSEGLAVPLLPPLPNHLTRDKTVLVAWKSLYRMGLFENGKPVRVYVIGLGQEPLGHKQKQGDNKTPEGDYKVVQKVRGPFGGEYGDYLGTAWMKINYPNNADALKGFRNRLITKQQLDSIVASNNAGKAPPMNTALGGGIGIHGWWGEWPENDRQNLTWGCISIQNDELDDLYRRVPVGTRLVVYP